MCNFLSWIIRDAYEVAKQPHKLNRGGEFRLPDFVKAMVKQRSDWHSPAATLSMVHYL